MQKRPDFVTIKRKIRSIAIFTLIITFLLTFLLAFLAFSREKLYSVFLPLAVGAFCLGMWFFSVAVRQYRLTQKAERKYKEE